MRYGRFLFFLLNRGPEKNRESMWKMCMKDCRWGSVFLYLWDISHSGVWNERNYFVSEHFQSQSNVSGRSRYVLLLKVDLLVCQINICDIPSCTYFISVQLRFSLHCISYCWLIRNKKRKKIVGTPLQCTCMFNSQIWHKGLV